MLLTVGERQRFGRVCWRVSNRVEDCNWCQLTFTLFECYVKNMVTWMILFSAPTDGSLYSLSLSLNSQLSPVALLSTKASSSSGTND